MPPTDETMEQHLKQANLQVCISKAAEKMEPPAVISTFGWEVTTSGIPEPVYGITEMAPKDLLRVVACSCKSEIACS